MTSHDAFQRLIVSAWKGKRRVEITLEIPTENVLVAAAQQLRAIGDGEHISAGRFESCVGVYWPSQSYASTEVDPFTGRAGHTRLAGRTPERCAFWQGGPFSFADTLFEDDPPKLHYYGRRVGSPQPELFQSCTELIEGAPQDSVETEYERNPLLRKLCIKHFGTACQICRVNLSDIYGEAAADLIHVHHIEPLGEVGAAHRVDPTRDLLPVCPNCHAVIHRRTPAFSPSELRNMLSPASRHSKGPNAG